MRLECGGGAGVARAQSCHPLSASCGFGAALLKQPSNFTRRPKRAVDFLAHAHRRACVPGVMPLPQTTEATNRAVNKPDSTSTHHLLRLLWR
jgi:hypothetical protein